MTTSAIKQVDNTSVLTAQSLGLFRKNFLTYDRYCLELVRFFGAHPNSRFGKLAVVHAIDEEGSYLKVERALTQLVGEGILKVNVENGTLIFLLTRNEPVRQLVLELARLDWPQWVTMLGQFPGYWQGRTAVLP